MKAVAGKVSIDTLEARNENEALVLRALKISKRWIGKPINDAELAERNWYIFEFDLKRPELYRAMIDLLKDFGATLDINDVKYFLEVLSNFCEKEYFRTSFSGMTDVPQGFSEGDLLEIRRTFIQRYLDEIPEDEDDPYNSPRLWYGFLIRPDVFCYER